MFFWIAQGVSEKVLRRAQLENQPIESVSRFFCESANLSGLLEEAAGVDPEKSAENTQLIDSENA